MENILEWECVLECNYRCKYCTNGHNGVIPEPIKYEKSKLKVFMFLDMLKDRFDNTELFLFGGEPFVHPFIEDIISHLNKIQLPFIIQTNGSVLSRIREASLTHQFKIQVSIHPDEIKNPDEYLKGIIEIQDIIRRIDIMYVGPKSLWWYKQILPHLKNTKILYLAPVADFNLDEEIVNNYLFEFNKLKTSIYGRVYQFEKGDRSFKWQEQMQGVWSPKGKPCMYKDRYFLFDPQLRSYSCNYRQNNEICPNQQCFLM